MYIELTTTTTVTFIQCQTTMQHNDIKANTIVYKGTHGESEYLWKIVACVNIEMGIENEYFISTCNCNEVFIL